MICTGFPASTTNHFTSNSSCSGTASMRTTCTPRLRRSRRTARAVSEGSAAASFSPNWMTSSMAGSMRRSGVVSPTQATIARASCFDSPGPRAFRHEQQRSCGRDACVLAGAVDNLASQNLERRGVATCPRERRKRLGANARVLRLGSKRRDWLEQLSAECAVAPRRGKMRERFGAIPPGARHVSAPPAMPRRGRRRRRAARRRRPAGPAAGSACRSSAPAGRAAAAACPPAG